MNKYKIIEDCIYKLKRWVTIDGQHRCYGACGSGGGGGGGGSGSRSFDSVDEIDEWDAKNNNSSGKDWRDSLTDEEVDAVENYSGGGYKDINDSLRFGDDYPNEDDIFNLDEALDKSKLTEDVVSWRGIGDSSFLGDIDIGDTFADEGFLSTSLSTHVADEYVSFGGSNRAYFRIVSKKGSSAGYFDGMSNFPTERELLIPRGSRMRLTNITTRNGMPVYNFEYKD